LSYFRFEKQHGGVLGCRPTAWASAAARLYIGKASDLAQLQKRPDLVGAKRRPLQALVGPRIDAVRLAADRPLNLVYPRF